MWFRALLQQKVGRDPAEELWEAARSTDETDRLAAAKLRVVAGGFSREERAMNGSEPKRYET